MLPKLSCGSHHAIEGFSVIRTVFTGDWPNPENPDGHGGGKPGLDEESPSARLGRSGSPRPRIKCAQPRDTRNCSRSLSSSLDMAGLKKHALVRAYQDLRFTGFRNWMPMFVVGAYSSGLALRWCSNCLVPAEAGFESLLHRRAFMISCLNSQASKCKPRSLDPLNRIYNWFCRQAVLPGPEVMMAFVPFVSTRPLNMANYTSPGSRSGLCLC